MSSRELSLIKRVGIDEEYYTDATAFLPERWYSQPEKIKHKNAFAPFSLGSENCIGKNCEHYLLRCPLCPDLY